MLRKVLLFGFLLSVFLCEAQRRQARVDSLIALLPSASDEAKLNLYVQIIDSYSVFNRKEGFKYEQPARELADKLKSERGFADIDDIIGRLYWRERKFDVAMKYHRKSLEYFQRVNNKSKVAQIIRHIGQDYGDGGNYPEALKQFFTSLSIYEALHDRNNMAYVYELLAWVYDKQGDYVAASKYSYSALKLREESGDPLSIALAASAVADYHIHLGNYESALYYFKRGGGLFKSKGDDLNLAYNYILIGKVHRLMKQYDESLLNYDSALAIGNEVNDLTIVAAAYNGMADVAFEKKDYKQAITRYSLAEEIFRNRSSNSEMAHSSYRLAECYRLTGRYDEARRIYNQTLPIIKEINSRLLWAEHYQGVERLDSTLGDWKDAYLNHKDYIINRDSVFNQDNVKKMVQLQLQHEFVKKEEAANLEQREKDVRRQRQVVFLGIIIFLVLVLACVLYFDQKRIKKVVDKLKLKSENLEEENREKESILKIVSHDLRSPFGKIKGLTELLQHEQSLTEAERKQYFEYIQTSIDQGLHLISHLLEVQSVNHPATPSLQTIDVSKFIHEFEQTVQRQLKKKRQQLHLIIESSELELRTDKQMLTRILDNLVSNASKFSNPAKSIYLRVWSDHNAIYFSIRDEGPGISTEDQSRLFRKFQKLSAQPTAGEESTGLGLSITKTLVEQLNGNIRIDSVMGQGTEVTVSFNNSSAA